jgi:diaminopimelate decarboxylase
VTNPLPVQAETIAGSGTALHYREGQLFLEDVSLRDIVDRVETPVYCYSSSILESNFEAFRRACADSKPLICFAVKANSNLAVLRQLAILGAGADVVSEGELRKALAAGIPASKIVFAGVGKKPSEIRFALQSGIAQFNVESEAELESIATQAKQLGIQASAALRVNPDVDAGTNMKITTGTKSTKFGIPISRAFDVYSMLSENEWIQARGLSVHIGSQLTSLEPFRHAFGQVVSLVEEIRSKGLTVETLDLGGGLGVTYHSEQPPSFAAYGQLVGEITRNLDCQIILEPGRCLVAPAGILLAQVILTKSQESRSFVVLDAAFNDLLRPGLYEAYHRIIPVSSDSNDQQRRRFDFVGPVCESSDTFCQNEESVELKSGDLVAILTAGAYGAVMASTYNTRPLVPEVLVRKDRFDLIRRRESYEEMLGRDQIPDWLQKD